MRREIAYRRFWQRLGDHPPSIATISLGPLIAGSGPDGNGVYRITRLEASDNGAQWTAIVDLPVNNWPVPPEHRQHRFWRIYMYYNQAVGAGFDNLMYEGGAYVQTCAFYDANGANLLGGMFTNPSTLRVRGDVLQNWFGQVWSWGLVGGINGGPAGGVSSGGVILAQSGSHSTLYSDCTYAPTPFALYGWFGWAETVWGTPGGYELTWTWDLTNGLDAIPGSGPAGELEEGWGQEHCQVKEQVFTIAAVASRGTLTVFDSVTGLRLAEGDDWELLSTSSGRDYIIHNETTSFVDCFYRQWGQTLRSRPGRGRNSSGNVINDRVRFSDVKGF